MPTITSITPAFAVTGVLRPEDIAAAPGLGFRSIISNLPDGEQAAAPTAGREADLAAAAGLGFRHIPATKFDVLSDEVIGQMDQALRTLEGPVLAHCASGIRSAVVWAGAAAQVQPVDCVLATLREAGIDLSRIREELEARNAASDAPAELPPALDCACDRRSA
ncbi:MAG TPA: TIGR01244 family sulfur transferase [Hyphomicrobiaceae bacterium]|nr:TIGR01244 family sulfur transferase [Hyphomicrobiaceae bacterium]